jgi:hypothetical protein
MPRLIFSELRSYKNDANAIKKKSTDFRRNLSIYGGTDVTTAEHKFVPTLPDFRDFSIFLKGIFSALIWPLPPLKMIVK